MNEYSSTCYSCNTIYTPLHDKGFGTETCPRCGIKIRDLSKEEKKARDKWEKESIKSALKQAKEMEKTREKVRKEAQKKHDDMVKNLRKDQYKVN